jgi:hypothetical protein
MRHRSSDPPDNARDEDGESGVGARLRALHARRLLGGKPRWSVQAWIISTVAAVVVLVAAFALVAVHYNDTVLNSNVCPSRTFVNGQLGTTLDEVSGIEFSDFHSCSYRQGADARALSIDVAGPGQPSTSLGDDPCRTRHPFTLAGHEACSMAGTPGTTPGRPSLFVETSRGNWQFSTDLPSVSMTQLEALGKAVLNP